MFHQSVYLSAQAQISLPMHKHKPSACKVRYLTAVLATQRELLQDHHRRYHHCKLLQHYHAINHLLLQLFPSLDNPLQEQTFRQIAHPSSQYLLNLDLSLLGPSNHNFTLTHRPRLHRSEDTQPRANEYTVVVSVQHRARTIMETDKAPVGLSHCLYFAIRLADFV